MYRTILLQYYIMGGGMPIMPISPIITEGSMPMPIGPARARARVCVCV